MNSPLRQTADQLGLTVSEPYRVGIGWELDRLRMHLATGRWRTAPRRNWRAARRSAARIVRRLPIRADWGWWQCEGALGGARRGPTARVAERRMLRDEINAALNGRPTP